MNPQLELFPTTPPSAGLSTSDPRHPRNPWSSHNASVFDQFTDDQLFQIVDWLQDHTYKQTRGLIKEEYQRDISHGAVQRFFERTSFLEHLDQSEQSAAAAREILRNTVSNQAQFSEATLQVLEQTAFNLALTSRTRPRDLEPLNRINNIICRSRNTAVRERHATVQEKKTYLRSRELDLKHQIFQARLDGRLNSNGRLNKSGGGTSYTSPTSFSDGEIDETNAAPEHLSTLNTQLSTPFDDFPCLSPNPLPPEVRAHNRLFAQKLECGEIRIVHTPDRFVAEEYCNPADKPHFADREKQGLAFFVPDPNRTTFLPPLRSFGEDKNSESTHDDLNNTAAPADLASTHDSSLMTHDSSFSSPSAPSASIPTVAPPMDPAELAARVDAYTTARAREYLDYHQKRSEWTSNDPNPLPQYITQYRHCPCGQGSETCPCPIHEDENEFGRYFSYFWTLSPFGSPYAETLRERNPPYRRPEELIP